MERQLIELETVCITDNDVTIAANLQADKPIYTNIFCDKDQFVNFLLEENSLIAKKIFDSLKENKINEHGAWQIDMQDINDNKPWTPKTKFKLEQVDSEGYEFICYRL
ncbi:MAG: hypothetical protein QY309_13185 [Cyclobacteriaceae bacterium]|nr:MAG: hypothetical protein QY309_13185 [Cyclobacteriaceae bacterium]